MQDTKLLSKSKNLSTASKCLLAASILLDFVDAANVGESKGDLAQTKRLARNLITTYDVYKATEAGSFIGKVTGSIIGGVGGGFLAVSFIQAKLDQFFEKRGW